MSRWSEIFDRHAIHATIENIKSALGADFGTIQVDHQVELRRLNKFIEYLEVLIKSSDPEIIPDRLLSAINTILISPQITGELSSYNLNKDVQSIKNINDYLNSQMSPIYQLSSISKTTIAPTLLRSTEKAYNKFANLIESETEKHRREISILGDSIVSINGRLSEISRDMDSLKSNMDGQLSQWQSEYTSAQTVRAEEFSNQQILRSQKFDELLRNVLNNSEKEIKIINEKHNDELIIIFENINKKIDAIMEDVDQKHKSILEIHRLVGSDGVAGGYLKTATDEQKFANNWRRISMFCLALAALWLSIKIYYGIEFNENGIANWAEIITAASLTIIFLIAARYASKQSSAHREIERQMRWFSLEVKAIDPFISSLEVDDQKELKKKFSEKLFGRERFNNHSKTDDIDYEEIKSVGEALLSKLETIAKIARGSKP